MPSLDYDIVLLPEEDIAAKAIRTSQELAPLGTEFTLSPTSPAPHVSLYMTRLKTNDLPEVEKRLAEIAARTPKVHLESDSYVQEEGYIDANYIRTPEAAQLQETIVQAINPLRDGLRPRDIPKLENATSLVRKNLETWGYRSVGELFRPHLTFTRFTNRQPIPLEDMDAPSAFSGQFARLALFEMGPNGTCIRRIKEFDLQ